MGKYRRFIIPRARERANTSYFIVIIFFAIFTVIVLTEIFLIDEKGRNSMGLGSRGRTQKRNNNRDYDETQIIAQHADDYIVYHNGVFESIHRGDDLLKKRLIGGIHYEPPAAAARKVILSRSIESKFPIMPNITASSGSWQTVPGTRYKFFVFSAYYDWRITKLIRVIGATRTRGPERVWCRFWYLNSSISTPGKVKVIRENWNLKYSACFVLCPLRLNQTVPNTLSIVSRLRIPSTNHLLVHNPQLRIPVKTSGNGSSSSNHSDINMAVCVKPIHFSYNRSLQIMEFLEMNALLGMNHVTLYNDTISSSTSCLLHNYESQGLVTILPWKLDMVSQREIRTEGLFAALNDCLYRNMYKYTHVALIDLDEIIMPKHNYTLPQFLQWMSTRMRTKPIGSFSFQNAFFYLQWPDDSSLSETDEFETNLITLRKTRRKVKLHPHKQRSKYICRPEYVVEAGNHFIWEFIPGHGTLNVPAESAILNHYRVCEFGGNDCIKSPSVIDKTALRYKTKLIRNIRTKWNQLKDVCGFEVIRPRVVPKIKL